jgi:hypothetical protein
MAETIRKTPPAADPETTNGALETASGRTERGKSLIDHLRANPEIVWDELGEQIDALIEALIVARLQIEGHAGATRQEIALDLYDEELITKRDAHEHGPFDDAEFYDALIARRRAHKRMRQ